MESRFASLKGKNVLITGSSRGIGRALAEGFAQNHANVAIHGVGNSEALDNTFRSLSDCGTNVIRVYGDLARPEVPSILIEQTVRGLGGIDILICNASIQIRRPWDLITDEEMERQTQVNFFGTIRLIQHAVPHMRRNSWGRILSIGSVQQSKPHPDMLIYAANKCAVRNVIQNLAVQLAPEHITANNIAVGTIYTDRNAEVLRDPGYLEKVRSDIPSRRIGDPTDCVGMALLLASEAGGYITGEDIRVDGGKSFC